MIENVTQVIRPDDGLRRRPIDLPPFFPNAGGHEVSIQPVDPVNRPIYWVVEPIRTINADLEGLPHPVTGIVFRRDIINLPDGRTVEGVFPEFESEFAIKLDEELYLESDAVHNREANKALAEQIELDPELRDKFDDRQIEQIKAGKTPDGYVWHHHQQPGVLQLIDRETHDKTAHTGGRQLWGGGRS